MATTTQTKLIAQLREILQLTQTEAQIAQVRLAQARTEAVRRELTENGKNAEERTKAVADALRELGGVPDVVTPALGRVAAFVKTGVEQAEPVTEALLQDLLLEHQLVDRARYVRALAVAGDQKSVVALADRLLEAHTATVEWLTTVLAEEALGGPAALAATPFQRVAGTATRVAGFPTRVAVQGVNKYVDYVQQRAEQVRGRFSILGDKASRFTGDAKEVVEAGRDATLRKAETVAQRDGADDTADAVHEARREAGSLRAEELPVKNYPSLSTQDAIARIKGLTKPEDIRTIVQHEEANKNRSSVVSAAQTRLAAVAKEAAGVS